LIKVSSNLNEVTSRLIGRLKSVANPTGPVIDKMLRTISLDTVAQMKVRIHDDGLNSEGKPLGNYSSNYLKYRRKKANRGDNPKVIFSLTRQMENDFNIVSGNGQTGYGLGFKNPDNAQKAQWLQEKPKFGKVYKPTVQEVQHMKAVAEQFIKDILNGENP
jgi:hypothetical protein